MKRSRIVAILAIALLVGCGKVGPLRPPPGQSLPVKPMMARSTPTPDELLTPPTYARPERVDELIKKSEPRRPDPFDLPPPSGGVAPALPAGSDPQPVSNDTGPVTPQ
jgi:predicted small lipoprotein YifL